MSFPFLQIWGEFFSLKVFFSPFSRGNVFFSKGEILTFQCELFSFQQEDKLTEMRKEIPSMLTFQEKGKNLLLF